MLFNWFNQYHYCLIVLPFFISNFLCVPLEQGRVKFFMLFLLGIVHYNRECIEQEHRRHNIEQSDIQHNDIAHNDTQNKGLICDTQHKGHWAQMTLSITTFFIERHYAECHYTKCRYAEWRGGQYTPTTFSAHANARTITTHIFFVFYPYFCLSPLSLSPCLFLSSVFTLLSSFSALSRNSLFLCLPSVYCIFSFSIFLPLSLPALCLFICLCFVFLSTSFSYFCIFFSSLFLSFYYFLCFLYFFCLSFPVLSVFPCPLCLLFLSFRFCAFFVSLFTWSLFLHILSLF